MSTNSASLPAVTGRIRTDGDARPISKGVVCGLLRTFDLCAIAAGGGIAYWLWLAGEMSLSWTVYQLVALIAAVLALNAFQLAGVYRWRTVESVGLSLRRTILSWTGVVALLLVAAFATKTSEEFSRAWLAIWFFVSAGLMGTARVILFFVVLDWKARGRLRQNVLVFGMGPLGRRVMGELVCNATQDVHVVGAFDDRTDRVPDYCWGVPLMGNLDDLISHLREHEEDTVIVALPNSAEDRLTTILDRLGTLPIDVRLCTDGIGLHTGPVGVSHYADVPMLNVIDRPLSGWRYLVKAIEDRILASLILLMIAPLMMLLAIAIKLDSPGPVLFRQKRYGFNNQLIEVWKFRTMHHHMRDENADQLTQRNDPRITRLGALLRKTSMDELPQFFNVLRGEMSIVGPRPHACHAKAAGVLYQQAVQRYAARHRVKPGITGWAQINGWRGETETLEQIRQRVSHDLDYIENWSLALDLKIILYTAFGGFLGRNAF